MKTKLVKILSVLLACCCLIPYGVSAATTAQAVYEDRYEQVEVWKRTDVILKSSKTYDNPYKDVEIDAVFTHEDGTEIKLYGFWNGENEWRVRFAPTKVGVWSYQITASDTANSSLHGKSGKLLAVENTGTTALDRHGFVKISENGRYFTYDDGTPFYWLGDTNWQAPNYVSLTQCNYPGCQCESQFLHELNDRLDKGFTVYQTYFDSAESDGGGQLATTSEPSLWLSKFESVDPETFSNKIDVMFDTLADSGMVIALGMGVHSHTTNAMNQTDLNRMTRYLTARYASYPIVWITAQEITGEPQFSAWNASAKIVDAGDGYHHPQGAHQFPSSVDGAYIQKLDKEAWHEFYALQAGHGPTIPQKSLYEGYWNNPRNDTPKPFVETEANYEDIICGGFNGYEASRITAWKANLSGSYGFTYGVTGVWANNYSTAGNVGWYGSFSYEPWYMGIDKPGSFEMKYMRDFFEYVDFSKLVPRFYDETYSDLTAENKVLASSDDGKTYVAYFYNASLSTGELRGLNGGERYSAKWYNPLTGKFVEIAKDVTVTDGVYRIPQKPTAGDWVLLVTSRELGEYETETAYTDDLIDTRTNFALDGSATVSSDNSGMILYGGAEAIDGDLLTYWCAGNGNMPQWLILDLGKTQSFAQIDLYLYNGEYSHPMSYASFTVEGSLDGITYTPIDSQTRAEPTPSRGAHLYRITKTGTYRYLKISFSEVENNWATISEIGVYETALETPEVKEDANILSGASASASGYTASDSTPAHAIDGNSSSWWCGTGDSGQWIQFTLKKESAFDTLSFTVYGGTTALTYTVETSKDGSDWTTVYTGNADTPLGKVGNSELYGFTLENAVTCGYIRINFDYVQGNWATIVELEATRSTGESDTLPTYAGTVQTPGITSVGSYVYTADGVGSDTKAALTDGDLESVWAPFGPIASQTILLDQYAAKSVYGIEIYLGKGAILPEYRIEGSLDGVNWTILADATLRDGVSYQSESRTVVSEALSGKYRYIKLLWLNGTSNSDNKTIAEIKLYAEGKTANAPEKADTKALLSVYQTAKALNNTDKLYTASSFGALNLARLDAAKALSPYATAAEIDAARESLSYAYDALISLIGQENVDFSAYISSRIDTNSHDIRFVLAADKDALTACESLMVNVEFDTASGKKSGSYTLDAEGREDFKLYYRVTGGGKTYEAIPNQALFGIMITDIPQNAWSRVTLTVTDGATVLFEGTCEYTQLIK